MQVQNFTCKVLRKHIKNKLVSLFQIQLSTMKLSILLNFVLTSYVYVVNIGVIKFASIGPTINAAIQQLGTILSLIFRNPLTIRYTDIATTMVWAVHIGGSFCIGEMFGRGAVGGYPVGELYHNNHR
eukprot:UN01488